MKTKFFIVLMSSLFVFACGKSLPTIDSRSDETYKASLERVSKSVPQDKGNKFDISISILAMESIKEYGFDKVVADEKLEAQAKQKFQQSLHGLNYEQILTTVDSMMKAKMEKAKKQYQEQLLATLDEIIASRNVEPELAKIVINLKQIDTQHLYIQVENKTNVSLTNLLLLGLVAGEEGPEPRVSPIDFEKPLAKKEKRKVVIPLQAEFGWTPSDYLAMPQIMLMIVRAENTKKQVLLNERLTDAFGKYVELEKNYHELQILLHGQKDWVDAFTKENIAKGFFPLK